MRPTAADLQSNPCFEGVLVSNMRFLETLIERTPEERIRFFQGLIRVLPQYPERVLKRKVSS